MNSQSLIVGILILLALAVLLVWLFVKMLSKGKLFNRSYKLYEKIGEGGMAVILRAKDLRLPSHYVAIKFLKEDKSYDKVICSKFAQEGENISRINEAYPDAPIVKVLEYGIADGQYFIAMEFLRGLNLKKYIENNKNAFFERKLFIVKEIARALKACHALKIIHRDVTPTNVFVDGNTVTLLDFGIAKHDFFDTETFAGIPVGKPYFMPPEQCYGGQVCEKSDIYSLGAIFYYLVEGHYLYSNGSMTNPHEIFYHQKNSPIPQLERKIPNEMRDLIYRMLDKEPQARPNASQVKDRLEKYLER